MGYGDLRLKEGISTEIFRGNASSWEFYSTAEFSGLNQAQDRNLFYYLKSSRGWNHFVRQDVKVQAEYPRDVSKKEHDVMHIGKRKFSVMFSYSQASYRKKVTPALVR